MRPIFFISVALSLAANISSVLASNCAGGDAFAGEGRNVGGAIVFTAQGLEVDADGAPNSYLVDETGFSPTCDGAVGIVNGRAVNPPAHGWLQICQNAELMRNRLATILASRSSDFLWIPGRTSQSCNSRAIRYRAKLMFRPPA